MVVYPLYSRMETESQLLAFKQAGSRVRKVVVCTNIGETSITIPGIVFVVDCLHFKQHSYNPIDGIEYLQVQPISKASADQRKGRAGRIQEGYCYRLCTEDDFKKQLITNTVPEMQRIDLAPVILQMKSLGI
eukprot:UN33470